MSTKIPISTFVEEIEAALDRKDGYIMGARGQNPKTGSLDLNTTKESSSWKENGYYYTQYSGSQRTKALYWREHATRVWDCNGLCEGIYEIHTGININQKARNNYAEWCDPKGTGLIPAEYRVPGAAVFWKDDKSYIHHVAYLYKPVNEDKPEGDWYLIEARGVNYGVVKTKLNSRKPDHWGWMTKYYDYSENAVFIPETNELGSRTLKKGMSGDDVKELQTKLLALGYSLPKYGADGDYGSETVTAVKAFQKDKGLTQSGEYDEATHAALTTPAETKSGITVTGNSVNIRRGDTTNYEIIRTADKNEVLSPVYDENEKPIQSKNGWYAVYEDKEIGWISGSYIKE